jgi:hypothetical protein
LKQSPPCITDLPIPHYLGPPRCCPCKDRVFEVKTLSFIIKYRPTLSPTHNAQPHPGASMQRGLKPGVLVSTQALQAAHEHATQKAPQPGTIYSVAQSRAYAFPHQVFVIVTTPVCPRYNNRSC